ncbi:hypothetical protein DPMN_114479 [Dreissena polymorpha]|uniref:Uncharacterized protein n=1 Tax=Dreissena polymorpha TaxID=45954 RepID=A0A9D4QRS0_DREPO|nr:hypothetical protein DPMN_114479 [Dreissena polymorpha]
MYLVVYAGRTLLTANEGDLLEVRQATGDHATQEVFGAFGGASLMCQTPTGVGAREKSTSLLVWTWWD